MEMTTLPKAVICVDYSNYHYYLKKKDWRIDWEKFTAYFQPFYTLQKTFFYEGIPSQAIYSHYHPRASLADFYTALKAKRKFHKFLRRIGFTVRSKPVQRLYDATEGCFKHKCNFDVELTIDVLDHLDELDVFVLCSGDGDFTKLVKYLKGKIKKTVIIAPSERLSHTLMTANKVVYLEDIRHEIERT